MKANPDNSLSPDSTNVNHDKKRLVNDTLGLDPTLGRDAAKDIVPASEKIELFDLESRYRIEAVLGRGGMGEVLLAVDTRLDRRVAIKRILGEGASSKTAVTRFLTESKAIAAINHPNIIQIYDYGQAEDGPFLIMEYVDGSSLLDRCRDGALPLGEAIDLACQLCDGIAKAHDLGIIHRDIKPANVLITQDGLPKLTDFGLAKAEATDHQMTMPGAVLGTLDFMPPEQRQDAKLVDARSDLWSLAATVYQMVTGRSPKIIRFKHIPESLQQILEKALDDAKERRYQSARHFRDDLRAVMVSVQSQPAGEKSSLAAAPLFGSSQTPLRPDGGIEPVESFQTLESSLTLGLHLGGSALKVSAVPTDFEGPPTYGHHFRSVAACAAFSVNGELLVGDDASREAEARDDAAVVAGFTTILGALNGKREGWAVHRDAALVDGRDGQRELATGDQRFSPEFLTGRLLQACASSFGSERLGDECTLVAALPATIGTLGHAAFRRAAAAVGMPVNHVSIVTQVEALACAWDDRCRGISTDAGPHMVVHWGGGHCEATLFDSSDDVVTVLATKGDASLGSDHCTARLVDHLLTNWRDVDTRARGQLWNLAEEGKAMLSRAIEARIKMPGKDLFVISRSTYEAMCCDVMHGIRELIRAVLADARVTGDAISTIYLTGAASRSPLLRPILTAAAPSALVRTFAEPERMAALGAGLRAAILRGRLEDFLLLATWPHSISVEIAERGCEIVVPRNMKLPATGQSVLETTSSRTRVLLYEGDNSNARDNELVGAIDAETSSRPLTVKVDVGTEGQIRAALSDSVATSMTAYNLPYVDMAALNATRPLPSIHEDDGISFGEESSEEVL